MTASSKSLKHSSSKSLKQPSSKSLGLPSTKSMSQPSSKAICQTASPPLDLPSSKSLAAGSNKSLGRTSTGNPKEKRRGKSSSRRHSKYPVRQTLVYILLDVLLPLFDLVSDGAVCVLLFLAGRHVLGVLTAVCMLGPHLALTYIQTLKCWMAGRRCVEEQRHCWILGMDEGIWRVPHQLVKKMSSRQGVGGNSSAVSGTLSIAGASQNGKGSTKPLVVLKLVICSLCSLPVILPYLLSQDVLAMATVSKHKRWGSRRRKGTLSHVRKSGSEGWLFKRRFLELFFQSPPQLLIQIATVLVLNNNSAVWGVMLGSVWGLSVGLTVCSIVSNMMLVLNFKCATGMSITDMLWFAVDQPGVVLRSSDTIMYLYRDRCRRLEIDVDNAEFVTFWGALLELIRTQDLTNLTVVHVSSSGGDDVQKRGGVRSDLRSLFEAVNQKKKSHVAEIQVDLSVFGGFVQV
ncbi:hypothetical protein BSKO_01355 [Bryopsis sp. KO-2023]|nr:hypothetical protein BSKO_01355 [Bryopsis sp. KO-2023]